MEIIWKQIPKYGKAYKINNKGEIKDRRGKILKTSINNNNLCITHKGELNCFNIPMLVKSLFNEAEIIERHIDEKLIDKRREASRKCAAAYAKRTNYSTQRKYTKKNPEMRMFHNAKNRAKEDGIEFAIELSDIIIPRICPYLGIEITNIFWEGKGIVKSNASLDRIDSSKGYIKGNVQVISNLANRMKSNATKEELITFAEGVLKIHRKI